MLLGPTVTFGFAFRFDGVDYIVVCVTCIGTFLSNVKKKQKKNNAIVYTFMEPHKFRLNLLSYIKHN